MAPKEWHDTERQIVQAWSTGDIPTALGHIETMLRHPSEEVRTEALMYRGHIRADRGEWAEAKGDFMRALEQMNHGTYRRYTTELSIGRACESLDESAEAIGWYRAALRTCVEGMEISASAALRAFLELERPLSAEDAQLVKNACLKSWRVLELPDTPNLDDLSGTLQRLRERESRSE